MDRCRNLEDVLEAIEKACLRSGRRKEEVKLLGASKTVPAQVIERFYRCGLRSFGENRAQEFVSKHETLSHLNIDWHFIGRLQTNKVKYLIGRVSLIHSVDRTSLAEEIQKRASRAGTVQEVLIEVNVGNEESKGGVSADGVKSLLEHVISLPNVKPLGLMTIPPYRENSQEVRPFFTKLRELRDKLEEEFKLSLPHLSMGMSNDFEVAIEEGATIVRVGTKLFGERS